MRFTRQPGGDVGRLVPQATAADYMPVQFHVPKPVHVLTRLSLWVVVGDDAANDDGFWPQEAA